MIGAFGNLTAYSFYVTKNVTTIEGGALATDDPAVAARVERLALHGLSLGAWERFSDAGFKHYEVVEPGFKFNMTDIQASLGLHQLPQLDAWIERRARLWDRYDRLLADLPVNTPPPPEPDTTHARHLYQVTVGADAPLNRDELLDGLTARRIGTGVHYLGVHLHPYYRDKYGLEPGQFPVATAISDGTLSLPLSPKVTEADQDDVVAALADALT
jgi:dTDP-4-amino-4,6-dideoxygalactose transaminase